MNGISTIPCLNQNSTIFKTINGDLTLFNKTLIATKDNLRSLETVNATVYNKHGVFNLEGLTTSATKSVSSFTKLSNSFKVYNGNLSKSTQLQSAYIKAVGNQNSALGNYLAGLNGAKASMSGYIKSLVAAKAASIGLQVASIALNTAITMGVSLAISALVSQISKWIHAQEEARQKSVELTNSYKEQQSSLDSQIEKYKELKETLDKGNLSTDESRSIKEQLLEIQQSLIESYGDEASNIDLVNGKYREQLGLLSELSKEKATDYVTENRDVFADAKEALEKIRPYNLGTVTSWSDYAPETEDQKRLIEYLETYSDLLDLTYSGGRGRGVNATSVSLSVKADVENADEIMHQLAEDLEKYGKDNNVDVSGLLEEIPVQLRKMWTDELKEYKTVYDEFIKAEIVRNDTLRPLYQESIKAVEDYNNALSTGEGVEEAKANLDSVQQSVQNATSELEGSQDVFDGIYGGINKDAEAAYNLGQAFENDKKVQEYAEQLRGLSDIDLKAINFEDTVEQPGEKAFTSLMTYLGYTKEEVQKLIDKLVELGYVQGEVQDSNPNKTDIQFSDIFALKDSEGKLNELGKINEEIDKFQSAYKGLKEAMDSYNDTGTFTLDQVQEIISYGGDYLKYLMDENGNLQLNEEALNKVAIARINEMRAKALSNLMDNLDKITNEEQALNYLETQLLNTATAYDDLTASRIKAWSEKALENGISQGTIDKVTKSFKNQVSAINEMFNNISLDSIYKSSSDSTKKEYEELFDFFERRIKVLNDSLDLLKSNMENVNGSFAKNNLLNAQSSIYQEQIRNYTDALTMYQREADKILATLPADIAEKIKNGAVDLTTFMGESSEAVVKAMKDYVGWSDAISNCQNQLAELKKTLEDLELSKFSNIIEDFTSQFDIRENSKNLIDQTKEWIESSGQLIGDSFFSSQIEQSQKQLLLLEQEKVKLVEQMNSALASGNVAVGSEAFLSMIDSLSEVESSIIDVKTELESLDTELKNLHWKNLDRVSDRFSDISEEIDNLIGLIDDIDVSDKNGNWSEEGLVQLGLYSQEYERATYASQMYAEEIEKLNQAYINGEYSLLEYQERLSSLTEEQWNNINASKEALDSIKQLNEERVNSTVDGINEEIEKYEELINAQIDALNSRKELEDYKKSISDKTKDINKLQREISAMEMDSSASTKALRLKKQEELQEALDELEQMQRDNSIEEQKKGLETQLKDYQASRESEIETLEDSLRDEQKLITQSFEVVKQNASTIGQQISNIAKQHGVTVSNTLISSWKQGENAIASYGSVLSSQSSAFIGNIMSVENEVWNLQNKANETAYSLAYMFSSQSDNLVNELTNSYNAEGNLYNMTNALQQSLINTLERGYDVSKIVGALNSIGDTADRVGKKLGDYQESKPFEGFDDLLTNDVGKNVGANLDAITPVNTNKNTNNQPKSDKYRLVDTTNSRVIKDNLTLEEIIQLQRNPSALTHAKIEKYASGTRNSKGSVIITDENGYELKLPKLSSGNYTIANEGSQILTKAQTDNIFDWAKFNPVDFMPSFKPIDLPKNSNIHKPIQIHNTITFTGAVNDANNFAKQIAQIADKQVTKSWKEFSDSVKY